MAKQVTLGHFFQSQRANPGPIQPPKAKVTCESCGKEFANEGALTVHVTFKHKTVLPPDADLDFDWSPYDEIIHYNWFSDQPQYPHPIMHFTEDPILVLQDFVSALDDPEPEPAPQAPKKKTNRKGAPVRHREDIAYKVKILNLYHDLFNSL